MDSTTLTTIASTVGFTKLADLVLKHLGVGLEKILSDRIDSQKKVSDRKKGAFAAVEEIDIVGDKLLEARAKGLVVSYEAGQVKISVDPNAKPSPELELLANRAQRITTVELKQQENVEDILALSAKVLSEHDEVSGRPVEEDWMNQFFDEAKKISSEEKKVLWSRVLAREVAEPGSFSIRTLDCLKKLSIADAQLIQRLSNLCIRVRNVFHPIVYRPNQLEGFPLTYTELLILQEIGLISIEERATFAFPNMSYESSLNFECGNVSIVAEFSKEAGKLNIPIFPTTNVGVEILSLPSVEPLIDYLDDFCNTLRQVYSATVTMISVSM